MQHISYFHIEANEAAHKTLPKLLNRDAADIVLEPVLTSRKWADRSSWRPTSVEIAVKLLYLAYIRDYIFLSNDGDARRILGSDAISIEVFDRWWTLRKVPWYEGSEDWHFYLKAVSDQIQPTGDPAVDQFLLEESKI